MYWFDSFIKDSQNYIWKHNLRILGALQLYIPNSQIASLQILDKQQNKTKKAKNKISLVTSWYLHTSPDSAFHNLILSAISADKIRLLSDIAMIFEILSVCSVKVTTQILAAILQTRTVVSSEPIHNKFVNKNVYGQIMI